jgi:hypothetical protein
MIFNTTQLAEIEGMAGSIVQSRHWDDLPWEAAWNGSYPLKPSENEIAAEMRVLIAQASRIMSSGLEINSIEEHIRLLHLENAESFRLYT